MYKTIVVGTDGSPTASKAVETAIGLAQAFDATLHVVRAYQLVSSRGLAAGVPEAVAGLVDADRTIASEAETALEALVEKIRAAGVDVVGHSRPGDAATFILDVAETEGADLIVVGNRGMQGVRRVLGSVPNAVTHHAPCAVLVAATC